MHKVNLSGLHQKKIALVLSGGVVKAAAWHLGVSLALEELGLNFKHNHSLPDQLNEISTYVGSSAGALICLYLACGLRPAELIEAHLKRKKTSIRPISYREMLSLKRPVEMGHKTLSYDPFDGLPTFLKKVLHPLLKIDGIFSTKALRDYLDNYIIHSNNFEDYKANLFIVATQLDYSRKCIFSKFNYPTSAHDQTSIYMTGFPIVETVAASMSVPPLYAPFPLRNPFTEKIEYYIDGEIRDTLSTHVAIDNECDFIISSWTHTPYHYQDEVGSLINYGVPAICLQAIYLIIQKKILTSRAHRVQSMEIIDVIQKYLKDQNFPNAHIQKLSDIIEKKLNYKKGIQFLDIFPKHENYRVFFNNTFSLSPTKTALTVSMGYKRTFEIFKRFEWEGIR